MAYVNKEKLNPLMILNFATFLQYQRFVMPISFLFYIYNGLNFSDFILCQSIYSATCLVGKFATGYLGDFISKKYIIICAYLLFLLRVLLWINFSGFYIILCGEILYGLFKALYRGNVDSYIYEYLEHKNLDSKMINKYGQLSFFNSLGSAISAFVGVIVYKYTGFKTILYMELVAQILAVTLLFLLPNIQTIKKKMSLKIYVTTLFKTLVSTFKNAKINFYVYYSAFLSGLTNVFVWNFQPILKAASAPVILYGVINFINQIFRSAGGLSAKYFTKLLKPKTLVFCEYAAVILSFGLLISSYLSKNYIYIFIALIIICLAILLFVVFGIMTVSIVHSNTSDDTRAATASVNSFSEDFMSFFLLLNFKFLYDKLGIINSLIIYAVVAIILICPVWGRQILKNKI